MKKHIKLIVAIGAAVVVAVVVLVVLLNMTGGNLDVVGNESITSFSTILTTIPGSVTADANNVGWALAAPDDSVRFIWSEDYSRSPLHDVMLEWDAQPFLDAGLDPALLPDDYAFYTGGAMGGMGEQMLMVGSKLGNDKLTYTGAPTALTAYEQIVRKYRSSINYHTALDHYGVILGGGNMFEWAKNLQTNSTTNEAQDKDIVFVLNPEPLIAAGVVPENVEGWVYAQVAVDEGGKTVEVWKFLKPFNIN